MIWLPTVTSVDVTLISIKLHKLGFVTIVLYQSDAQIDQLNVTI